MTIADRDERLRQKIVDQFPEVDRLSVPGRDRDGARAMLAQAVHGFDPIDDIQVLHLLRIGFSAGRLRRPHVEGEPGLRFGDPQVKGISTEAIATSHWLNDNPEDDYGLTRHELLVALWFEATQGQREISGGRRVKGRFRRPWREWGAMASQALWSSKTDVDQVPLPPTKDDR